MFYRTTLSIYRIAPQDKAWLYSDPSSESRPSLPALTSQSEPGSGDAPALLRAATAPADVPDAGLSTVASSGRSSAAGAVTAGAGAGAGTGTGAGVQQEGMQRGAAAATAAMHMAAAGAAGSAEDSAQAAAPGAHGKWLVQMSDCLPPCIGGVAGDATASRPDLAFPPLMYGRLSSRLRGGDVIPSCIAYALCGMCCGCVTAAPLRAQIRRKYSLPEEPFSDGLTHLCCSPCAVWQEYREIEAREGPWQVYYDDARRMQQKLDREKEQRQQQQRGGEVGGKGGEAGEVREVGEQQGQCWADLASKGGQGGGQGQGWIKQGSDPVRREQQVWGQRQAWGAGQGGQGHLQALDLSLFKVKEQEEEEEGAEGRDDLDSARLKAGLADGAQGTEEEEEGRQRGRSSSCRGENRAAAALQEQPRPATT